jgi:hypothetical protein
VDGCSNSEGGGAEAEALPRPCPCPSDDARFSGTSEGFGDVLGSLNATPRRVAAVSFVRASKLLLSIVVCWETVERTVRGQDMNKREVAFRFDIESVLSLVKMISCIK